MSEKKKGVVQQFKDDNVKGAQRELLEELFYDMYVHRKQVYVVNFFRGISFGIGSVLGATLLVTTSVWVLSWFVEWVPFLGDFIRSIIDTVQRR